ncbi:MAG: GNAT family N-acetyltransferase [Actinomycetota bacterium]
MEIRTLQATDDQAMAAAYAVECAATARARPQWVPLGEAARVNAWRAANGWRRTFLGAFDQGELIGLASCETADDTPDTAWVNVSVMPDRAGSGVGSALTAAAEAAAAPRVTRFVARAYRPSPADAAPLIEAFAAPLGYTVAATETVVELDLERADLPAAAPHHCYSVETSLDGVPEALRAEVGVLKGLVDAEAPNGELDWKPAPVSPEDYAAELETWQRQGRRAIETVAVDKDSVVAWTCLVVPRDPRRPAQIEGTLVRSEHRGKRLGTTVKVANLHRARELGVRRVRTSSNDTNRWMRAINAELGFRPVETEVLLHKRLGS